MVTQEDLTLSGGHTVQYTDDVSELYTGNLYNFINQSHPNKFNFFKYYVTTLKSKSFIKSLSCLC